MVNPSHASNQSSPEREDKSAKQPTDSDLLENSQENLDARLDHAIEETFPTSDPVSVTITKGPKPDQEARSPTAGDRRNDPRQASTDHILDRMKETLHEFADQATGAAREAYGQGEHYARHAGEKYPEAERYIRKGRSAVTRQVTGNPLLALFMAGAAGYALAWLIHGERRNREPDVPNYGRTERGYAPHRDKQGP